MKLLESSTVEGDSPVSENFYFFVVSQVVRDTWNPLRIHEDHLVRLNISKYPIVN